MNEYITKPEILAPAGDEEALSAALRFGADAVYVGAQQFGMRTSPKNFDEESLPRAVRSAHELGKKLYLTCNILPRETQLPQLPDFLAFAQQCSVDALIIADLGVFELAKKYAPNVPRHVSTQAGIVNSETAKAFYNMGADRVVLARELSFGEISAIRANIPKELEIECFVQGAMCVSFSGRCLISEYLTGRDPNRGDCSQPCRWKYHLFEENREGNFYPVMEDNGGTFLYNSKDMCMIDYIPELVKAGISSFKIEGRAKTAYYSAVTTNAYRQAVDAYFSGGLREDFKTPELIKEELEKISHREYSTGFYLGTTPGQTTSNGGYIRHYDLVALCEQECDFGGIITQRNKFYLGDIVDVLPPGGIPFTVTAQKLVNENGEEVDSTPHPMERLELHCEKKIPAGSFLRVRKKTE
ncbi:MAG: U32 family peptidase [Clostridia bacterium]|nr:U32 family peptidase [Clostridia bacterium]